jgi:hypothetical protein
MMTGEEAKVKAKSIAKKGLLIGVLALLLGSIGYYFYRTYTISEGTRSGNLFKISKKGILFKTYEGQLHLGGSQMMSATSIWEFSAKNEEVYNMIQKNEGKDVKLSYIQMVNPFFWQGDTDYIVTGVEPVK